MTNRSLRLVDSHQIVREADPSHEPKRSDIGSDKELYIRLALYRLVVSKSLHPRPDASGLMGEYTVECSLGY
jgi:hypothetical protein